MQGEQDPSSQATRILANDGRPRTDDAKLRVRQGMLAIVTAFTTAGFFTLGAVFLPWTYILAAALITTIIGYLWLKMDKSIQPAIFGLIAAAFMVPIMGFLIGPALSAAIDFIPITFFSLRWAMKWQQQNAHRPATASSGAEPREETRSSETR